MKYLLNEKSDLWKLSISQLKVENHVVGEIEPQFCENYNKRIDLYSIAKVAILSAIAFRR